MNSKHIASAALLSIFVSVTAFAQSAERLITAEERRQVGVIVPHLFETVYVIPETGQKIAEQLRVGFASGKYDSATTAPALAQAIHRDLAVASDRHVSLRYTGREREQPVLTVERWNERRAAMESGAPRPGPRPADADAMRRANYGVLAAEVLEGNVGYLKIGGFMDTDETRAAMSSAMALLANTDAMIVDVRNCPGGSADSVSYLASYFFEPGPRVLMNRYNRPMNRSFDSTTVDVPGKRMPDTDLYVLTGNSASACESFAFTLQQWGRAKTVGEKTAGAGNNNMFVDLGAGLTLSISIGNALHPKTRKGFEGVGVLPDIAAPADRARDTAHAEALRKLGVSSTKGAPSLDPIAEVRALEREWLDAYEKRDAGAMNRIVADDFLIFFENGNRQSKSELLAMIARGAGKPAPAFSTDDVQARAYGDTVILTGRVVTRTKRPDGTTSESASRYTDTYVRRNGRWQVASSHLGRVKGEGNP
jgi:ketosteroid isomerase-like protein